MIGFNSSSQDSGRKRQIWKYKYKFENPQIDGVNDYLYKYCLHTHVHMNRGERERVPGGSNDEVNELLHQDSDDGVLVLSFI